MSPPPPMQMILRRFGTLLAFVAALFFHALWAVLPFPRMEPREREPTVAHLTLYPEARAMVWSPTMFSLPTTLGFSGVMERESNVVLPPLDSPVDLTVFYEFDLLSAFPEVRLPPPDRLAAFVPLTPDPMPDLDRAPAAPVFRWVLRTGGEGETRIQSFRPPRVPTPPRALRLTGSMEFDLYGQVTHLVLDPGGPTGSLRGEAAAALRLARVPRGAGPLRTRFDLALEPREVAP